MLQNRHPIPKGSNDERTGVESSNESNIMNTTHRYRIENIAKQQMEHRRSRAPQEKLNA